MDLKKLLVAFLTDISAYDRKDLDGNKIGGYEFVSGGSVGGHMHALCFDYLLGICGRDTLVQACLEIQEYQSFLYSDASKGLWDTTNAMHELKDMKIGEVAERLMEKHQVLTFSKTSKQNSDISEIDNSTWIKQKG